MTLRLLHTADLHLDSPLRSLALRDRALAERVGTASRRALARIVDACLAERVAALLIAGDLYDGAGRSARTAAHLAGQLQRLAARGIPVYAIRGNHDAESPVAGEFPLPDNVHVFDGRGGRVNIPGTPVWVHGVSFRDRRAPESLLPRFGPPEPGAVNIGLLHSSLGGAEGHDAYAPCAVADLVAHGFDYWALGHVHRRQVHAERPWVVMPGMPQGRDIGEAGPKSATLLTLEGRAIAIEEVPTSVVEFRRSRCELAGAGTAAEVEAALARHLAAEAEATRSEAAVLRLTLAGATPLAWQIRRDRDFWRDRAEARAADTGRVWIEALELALEEPGAAPGGPAGTADPVAELARLMAAIAAEEGFRAEAQAELAQALALLPRERRAALAPDPAAEAALIDRLAAEAALSMTARMRGAAQAAAPAAAAPERGEDGG